METAAYWTAMLTVVTVPPFLLLWFIVHPLVRYWRRLGPALSYLIVLSFIGALMVVMFLVREPLLEVRFGVRWPLVGLAAVLFIAGGYLGVLRWRRLRPAVMFGLPEISAGGAPGRLITEGIYARIRHPRYVEAGIMLAAVALFANYLAPYLVALLYVPMMYATVILEERELKDRFGPEYERYCRRVPRFVPRFGRPKDDA